MDPTLPVGPLTCRDYFALPEDGKRHELINGELYVTPSPTWIHQQVSLKLSVELFNELQKRKLGIVLTAPIDVVLGDRTVVVPDLCVIRDSRRSILGRRAIEGPPDLVIEILSVDRARDTKVKRKVYAQYGIPEYFIVDPQEAWVDALALKDGANVELAHHARTDTLRSTVFPELQIALERIFDLS